MADILDTAISFEAKMKAKYFKEYYSRQADSFDLQLSKLQIALSVAENNLGCILANRLAPLMEAIDATEQWAEMLSDLGEIVRLKEEILAINLPLNNKILATKNAIKIKDHFNNIYRMIHEDRIEVKIGDVEVGHIKQLEDSFHAIEAGMQELNAKLKKHDIDVVVEAEDAKKLQ